jgi:hypothetical protein
VASDLIQSRARVMWEAVNGATSSNGARPTKPTNNARCWLPWAQKWQTEYSFQRY